MNDIGVVLGDVMVDAPSCSWLYRLTQLSSGSGRGRQVTCRSVTTGHQSQGVIFDGCHQVQQIGQILQSRFIAHAQSVIVISDN